jgi:hypothetical protein
LKYGIEQQCISQILLQGALMLLVEFDNQPKGGFIQFVETFAIIHR